MKHLDPKKIFKKLSQKGYKPEHVAEVGVYHPETSNIYDYIEQGIQCTLVEPDPSSIRLIQIYFSNQKNVKLYPVAIYDFAGKIELVHRDASTFAAKIPSSPAIINDGYLINKDDQFTVEAKTFDEIDDGTIDLLSVDIEGGEWFVIKHMTSRPSVISLETHGAIYTNPFLVNIIAWMKTNGYVLWYKDKSDSVFVKEGDIPLSLWDKNKLIFMNFYIAAKRKRKQLKRFLVKGLAPQK